ncbi:MAG: hypothetical protein WCI11_02925 [Candidatus Methylumidiphilus sp.]
MTSRNNAKLNPRTLERRVRLVGRDRMLGIKRFCFLFFGLTANAAKFFKYFFEKARAVNWYAKPDKKIWIFLVATMVSFPCSVEADTVYWAEIVPKFMDGPFMFIVETFNLSATVKGSGSDTHQSINQKVASQIIGDEISVKIGTENSGSFYSFVSFLSPYIESMVRYDSKQPCDDSKNRNNSCEFQKWLPVYISIYFWIFIVWMCLSSNKKKKDDETPNFVLDTPIGVLFYD